MCQANPSVARGPLNYCPPWSDQTCTHKCAWHINLHSLTGGLADNYIHEVQYSLKPRVVTGVNVQGSPLMQIHNLMCETHAHFMWHVCFPIYVCM